MDILRSLIGAELEKGAKEPEGVLGSDHPQSVRCRSINLVMPHRPHENHDKCWHPVERLRERKIHIYG